MSILEALVDSYKSELKYRVSILEALVDSYKSELKSYKSEYRMSILNTSQVKDVNPRGIGGFIQVRADVSILEALVDSYKSELKYRVSILSRHWWIHTSQR